MKFNKLHVRNIMQLYKPMPLWYRDRNYIDEQTREDELKQQWVQFQNSTRYKDYIKSKLVYEIELANRFITKYNINKIILQKILTKMNISQHMFVYKSLQYLIY